MLRILVILSTRQNGIAGLGAKDLVSNTKSRFFAKAQNDNTLGNFQKCHLTLINTTCYSNYL